MATSLGDRRLPLVADGVAAVLAGSAAVAGVLLLLPAEGFLSAPLHQGLLALLGQTAYVLPPLLLLGAAIRLLQVPLPTARLVGLALLLLAVPAAEQMLVDGAAGAVGRVLAEVLVSAIGAAGGVAVLIAMLAAGTFLTFGVRLGQK